MPDQRVAVYLDFDNIVISRYDQVHGKGSYQRDRQRAAAGDRSEADFEERLGEALVRAMPEARTAPALRIGSFGSSAHSLGAASLPLFIDFAPRAGLAANARPAGLRGGPDHARSP